MFCLSCYRLIHVTYLKTKGAAHRFAARSQTAVHNSPLSPVSQRLALNNTSRRGGCFVYYRFRTTRGTTAAQDNTDQFLEGYLLTLQIAKTGQRQLQHWVCAADRQCFQPQQQASCGDTAGVAATRQRICTCSREAARHGAASCTACTVAAGPQSQGLESVAAEVGVGYSTATRHQLSCAACSSVGYTDSQTTATLPSTEQQAWLDGSCLT